MSKLKFINFGDRVFEIETGKEYIFDALYDSKFSVGLSNLELRYWKLSENDFNEKFITLHDVEDYVKELEEWKLSNDIKEKFLYRKSDGEEYKILSTFNMHGEWWFDVLSSLTGFIHSYSEAELSNFISDLDVEQYLKEKEEWKLKNEKKEEVNFKYEVGQELIGMITKNKVKITNKEPLFSTNNNRYEITYEDGDVFWMNEEHIINNYELIEEKPVEKLRHSGEFKKSVADEVVELTFDDVNKNGLGRFERIAAEIGSFTQMKNEQYGSSVDATYGMMKVLLERYRYDDKQYLIPEELIQHILLQVRMMDKQNRIFQNPSGEGDSESPYRDLCGYSLIGIDMVEK